MEGKAMHWHQAYTKSKKAEGVYMRFIDFVKVVATRFSGRAYESPYANLNSFSQIGSLQEYLD